MRTVKPQTRPFSPRLFLLNGKWAKLEHCSPPIDSPIIITKAGRSPRACLLDLQSSTSIGDKKELGHETNNINFDNFAIPYFLCAEEADGTSTATHHAKPVSLPYKFPEQPKTYHCIPHEPYHYTKPFPTHAIRFHPDADQLVRKSMLLHLSLFVHHSNDA